MTVLRSKPPCPAPAASSGPLRGSNAAQGGVKAYDRARHLARLLPVGPATIADDSPAGRRRILALLARALRAERVRGRAGHWTYDLNRHIALRQAFEIERAGAPRGWPRLVD